ncbi:DUF4179 domain-containing protein [Acinetobacter sp. MD2(2019)]|uniref:DUF4179 domain-containing protein n=1 Tax=Acinetobacter sp. MD2(2019) TaxID=2605273 RepID=UPI002D1EECA0|nr:DUF4179 domain-containing protein [Acinetobacter sp. MD2(2019)]MEB3754333.1 DUF4179 domain-containing protein [Acinetobacter sp. MD2(2019)]
MILRTFLLGALCLFQLSQTHALSSTALKKAMPTTLAKHKVSTHSSELLSNELNKQKKNVAASDTDLSDIKLLTSIRVQPTQSFFAYQHERFSRFWQTLFPTPNS